MKAVIVVPWRGGNAQREANWAFCRPWWERFGYEIFQVEHGGPEPFNRAWCINEGARRAGDWDVICILDADTLEDRDEQVPQAIIRAYETGLFTVAHVAGYDLDEQGTAMLHAGKGFDWHQHVRAKREVCDSRVNMVRRDTFEKLGGYDTRFEGWGHEDVAFTAAVRSLGGDLDRIEGNSWHLFHEPQLPLARPTKDWKDGKALADRYLKAGSWKEIRRILEEREPEQRFEPAVTGSAVDRRMDVEVELVVITNGRKDYLEETLASARERLKGRITKRTLINDCVDPAWRAWLDANLGEEFEITHHRKNLGFTGMMGSAREQIRATDGPPYVFWLEEDFVFDRNIDLDEMATLLDKPGLYEAALLRGPFFSRERKVGSIPDEHRSSYRTEVFRGVQHLAHRRFFTTNPNLTKRESFERPWLTGSHSESRFGEQLWEDGLHVAFLGDGQNWCSHIGKSRRGGHGY